MAVRWDVDGYQYVVFDWLLYAITTPLVAARLYVQLRYKTRPWRELLVLVAWIEYTIWNICDSICNGDDYFNLYISGDWGLNLPHAVNTSLLLQGVILLQVLYLCKGVMLCLYFDLVSRGKSPKTWWAIVATSVCVFVAAVNDFALGCMTTPIVPDTPSTRRWYRTAFPLHLFTDILVFIIPFFILRSVKGITKGTYALFALGILNIGCAVMFIVNFHSPNYEWLYYLMTFIFSFQLGTALMIICLQHTRRLWRDLKGGLGKEIGPPLGSRAILTVEIEEVQREGGSLEETESLEKDLHCV